MKTFFTERIKRELAELKAQDLQRQLRCVEKISGTQIQIGGRELLNFSSNDYLGLASHPALQEAAARAARDFGFGATASRLICGTTSEHMRLEEELAAAKQTEAALLFPTGYAASSGTLSVLMERGDVILLDKLAHASLVDGTRQSKATLRIFRHNDLNQLEEQLQWARKKFPQGTILIVTESIFSMDGDAAPLREIVTLKERYGALLFLDEAHAIGVRGAPMKRMGGLAGELGLADKIDLQIGTLGKAVGAAGGYLCGSRQIIDFLLHRARSFMFSTAPPAPVAAAARAGITIINSEEGEKLAEQLWKNISFFQNLSHNQITSASSAILPLIVGQEKMTLSAAQQLWDLGFYIPAIRYPTVPRDRARLRITLSSAHEHRVIEQLAGSIEKLIFS
ncbi:MAG: 8-amino-7-oxononanoate synthase [Chthoniobacterales bacterium]|nr:8-amino-7-oxononanoate synthase [Chthoniobacterales bacterium]